MNDLVAGGDAWYGLHCEWKCRQVGSLRLLSRFHVVRHVTRTALDKDAIIKLACPIVSPTLQLPRCAPPLAVALTASLTRSRGKCLLEERPRYEQETALQAPTNDLLIQQSLDRITPDL